MRIRRRVRCCPPRLQELRRGQCGFTLIEMMVVITILGIVAAIAMPTYSAWQERSAVTEASTSLMAYMKQARTLAMAENRYVTIAFASSSYTFDQGTCSQCKNLTVDLGQFSNNIALSSNVTPLTFTSAGTLKSGNSTVLGATVTLDASGSYTHTITVNMIGRAYQ